MTSVRVVILIHDWLLVGVAIELAIPSLVACHISFVPRFVSKACLRVVIVVIEAIVSPTVHLKWFVRQMVMFALIEHALLIVLLGAHHIFGQLVIIAVVLSLVELGREVMVVVEVYSWIKNRFAFKWL